MRACAWGSIFIITWHTGPQFIVGTSIISQRVLKYMKKIAEYKPVCEAASKHPPPWLLFHFLFCEVISLVVDNAMWNLTSDWGLLSWRRVGRCASKWKQQRIPGALAILSNWVGKLQDYWEPIPQRTSWRIREEDAPHTPLTLTMHTSPYMHIHTQTHICTSCTFAHLHTHIYTPYTFASMHIFLNIM